MGSRDGATGRLGRWRYQQRRADELDWAVGVHDGEQGEGQTQLLEENHEGRPCRNGWVRDRGTWRL